jgi:hydrogenase nickel incorporation protein HypA/HybF
MFTFGDLMTLTSVSYSRCGHATSTASLGLEKCDAGIHDISLTQARQAIIRMHELSLCQNLLGLIEQQASLQAFSHVRVVRLELGDFAAVDMAALGFAFEIASRNTLAEHARLEIISVSGDVRCVHCQQQVIVRHRFDACPACGRFGLQISGGDELRITELEVV